mmetsp:Transcript_21120/g.38208  ORF Transcript_21120/g.38208 Transcript_21120/m.38208 type:complete len:190 (-) Transcript_21120:134-703(-)|eukprot:CAMPEP_0201909274 /NCGR_PEP_ID=MMETSP0903-20130614/1103_1 /ASSEMBLY_ACC=CAM_ASM_000552 /TAXON_ID=420261 /ORGANISM="Thalassiosira antarctica, Strain CCMP982" /LENGTH=189 /DNA_ID=CAMNT_0048443769 /DNA_START=13 /DNA_END=582 /DNA_ORIENTATION=+
MDSFTCKVKEVFSQEAYPGKESYLTEVVVHPDTKIRDLKVKLCGDAIDFKAIIFKHETPMDDESLESCGITEDATLVWGAHCILLHQHPNKTDSDGSSDEDSDCSDDEAGVVKESSIPSDYKKARLSDENEEEGGARVGMRVSVRFDESEWYDGTIVKMNGGGEVKIRYDDGSEEDTKFPDDDIVIKSV